MFKLVIKLVQFPEGKYEIKSNLSRKQSGGSREWPSREAQEASAEISRGR